MTNMLAEMAPSQNPRLRRTMQVSRTQSDEPELGADDYDFPSSGTEPNQGRIQGFEEETCRHTCQGFTGGGHGVRRVAEANRGKHVVGGRQRRMRMQGRVRIVILAVVPFAIHDVGVDGQRELVKSRRTQTRRFGGEGRRSRSLQGIKLRHLHPSVSVRTCDVRGKWWYMVGDGVCRWCWSEVESMQDVIALASRACPCANTSSIAGGRPAY